MATTIFHEGPQLKIAATAMGSTIQSMTNIENAIARIHSQTAPSWQGKAAEQDTRNFNKLRQMTTAYLEDARQTKAALDEAIVIYDNREKVQIQKVSRLDTKGIFLGGC